MMLVLSLARAAPARPRCASVVSKGPVPQPSGPQRSGGRPWSVFLVSRGAAARRGKKVGQGRCGVPDQRSGLLTDGAFREAVLVRPATGKRSEEHTSELQSLMRISYAVFCLKKKNKQHIHIK